MRWAYGYNEEAMHTEALEDREGGGNTIWNNMILERDTGCEVWWWMELAQNRV
jgi:hypothetical protein